MYGNVMLCNVMQCNVMYGTVLYCTVYVCVCARRTRIDICVCFVVFVEYESFGRRCLNYCCSTISLNHETHGPQP